MVQISKVTRNKMVQEVSNSVYYGTCIDMSIHLSEVSYEVMEPVAVRCRLSIGQVFITHALRDSIKRGTLG